MMPSLQPGGTGKRYHTPGMFVTRLITAAVLLPLFAGALLFLPNVWWVLLLFPVLLVASLEWAALAGWQRAGKWLFAAGVALSAAALLVLPGHGATSWRVGVYWAAMAFWLAMVPAWLLAKRRIHHKAVMGIAGWITLVPAWLALAELQFAPADLLMLLGVVWVADSAAYVAGRRFGRRRLAPDISPGKTWEGVAGACAAVAVYYVTLWLMFAPQQPLLVGVGGAILFVAIMVMSIEGDLFESWIKRQAGVKDSGRLLPGHGGVLDRIDGLTASMPFAALWCQYWGACGSA